MKKRFVVLMNFLLGGAVINIWLTNKYHSNTPPASNLTLATILLLVLCWGTPILLLNPRDKKKNRK